MHTYKLLFFCLFLLWSSISQAFSSIEGEDCIMCDRQRDSLAMVAIFNAMNGPTWMPESFRWDTTQPMDTWTGVYLSDEGCVTGIDLDGFPDLRFNNPFFGVGATGILSPEIGLLSELETLILTNNAISGELPTEIGQLLNLKTIHLDNNDFVGSIPGSIREIRNLSHLVLSNNNFSGPIDPMLGDLQRVRKFDLSFNQLTGEIPSLFVNLGLVDELKLNNNQLSGSIPGAVIDRMFNLEVLHLHNNRFTGCYDDILQSKLCDIEYNLSGNPFLPWQGDFSMFCTEGMQIGAPCDDENPITDLDKIQVDCTCRGTIFDDMACRQRDSLTLVELYNSTDGPNWRNTWNLNDPIDTWYGIGVNENGCVQTIDLDDSPDFECNYNEAGMGNGLNGSLPLALNTLKELEILNIASNDMLTGNIPLAITQLDKLRILYLPGNSLDGAIPPDIGNLKSLEKIHLGSNQFTGSIPTELGQLINLVELDLSNNQFGEVIPTSLALLTNLERLNLSENNLRGNIPEEFGNLTKLIFIHLNNNELIGCIPANLMNLCRLITDCSTIDICPYNFANPKLPWRGDFEKFCEGEDQEGAPCDDEDPDTIDDVIKDCICRGTPRPQVSCRERDSLALVSLYISTGGLEWTNTWDLSTPITTWYGIILNNSDCVEEINLSNNNLTQNIPPEIGELKNLKILDLSSNSMRGDLTLEVRSLSILEVLNLSNNQFEGGIPFEYSILTRLTELYLSNNDLIGEVPFFFRLMTNLEIVDLGNNAFSGCLSEELKPLCDIDFRLDGNGLLPWIGDFSQFCSGEDQIGATCQDRFITTVGDTISDLCECNGICITPSAGADTTTMTLCHGEELDLSSFVTGDEGGRFRIQGGRGLIDFDGSITEELYEVGLNQVVYQVDGTLQDCRISDQATINISVADTPYFDFVGDTIVCNDGSTTLSINNASATSFLWSTGSEETELLIEESGDYSLSVINDSLCAFSESVYVDIRPSYNIDITGSASICEDESYTLGVISEQEDLTYMWSTNSTESTINLTEPGPYAVTTTDAFGCEAFAEIDVMTLEEVNIEFTDVEIICGNEEVTIGIVGNTFESYAWSTGETSDRITITEAGMYRVTLVDENGCEAIAMKEIRGIDAFEISLDGPQAVCNDQSYTIVLADEATFSSYAWSTGERSEEITIQNPDTYTLTVTDENGCTSSASINVVEAEGFSIDINGPAQICGDEETTLSVEGNYRAYSWSDATTEETLIISAPGTYAVTVTDDAGCAAMSSIEINAFPALEAEIDGPREICDGEPYDLTVVGDSILAYTWSTGSNENFILADSAALFKVTLTGSNGCIDSINYSVDLYDLPIANSDRIIIPYDGSITPLSILDNDNFLSQSEWKLEIIDPPSVGTLEESALGIYDYIQVENQPKEVTFMYRICSETCPGYCDEAEVVLRLQSFLENCEREAAITPNGDGINDNFVTCVKNLALNYPDNTLVVYNRWGQVLYEASPYDNNWNGMTASGQALPQSTYYYTLRLKSDSSLELGGTILLIR